MWQLKIISYFNIYKHIVHYLLKFNTNTTQIKNFSDCLFFSHLIKNTQIFVGPASVRSYEIGVVGNNWLVGWLVGNAVFSETVLRIFLIICMKLGDYKGRKVPEPDFWKKFLIWRYSRKGLQIRPKSDTSIFFSKTALIFVLVFGLKLVLNITFNLNETYFSEKLAISRLQFWPQNCKKITQIEVFAVFSTLHH